MGMGFPWMTMEPISCAESKYSLSVYLQGGRWDDSGSHPSCPLLSNRQVNDPSPFREWYTMISMESVFLCRIQMFACGLLSKVAGWMTREATQAAPLLSNRMVNNLNPFCKWYCHESPFPEYMPVIFFPNAWQGCIWVASRAIQPAPW